MQSRVRQVSQQAVQRAKRARTQLALLVPATAAVIIAYLNRGALFGADLPVRVVAVVALVVLGWALAKNLGRAVWPSLERRMDPGTAGTVGFLIRLLTIFVSLAFALRFAGIRPQTLAVGGAFTAVIVGLAAQQTIGNLIAGTVLMSARPFRVGDRVRMHAGGVAGQVEGTVVSLGLLYTTLANGEDRIMVPNNVVLSAAVVPLRNPSGVDMRARLMADVKPSDVQRVLGETVSVPTRSSPHVELEEVEGDELVVRVKATPLKDADGPALADQVVAALDRV